MKFGFSRQIFEKVSSKSVQGEPTCSMQTDGRTEGHDEANIVAYRNLSNAPKIAVASANSKNNTP